MNKLAIFDCDGTLVDSGAPIYTALSTSLQTNGFAVPPASITRRVPFSAFDLAQGDCWANEGRCKAFKVFFLAGLSVPPIDCATENVSILFTQRDTTNSPQATSNYCSVTGFFQHARDYGGI